MKNIKESDKTPQAALDAVDSQSTECTDFTLIAAKAIVETAENFINERLNALAAFH
jgi:hypothetical protein